MTAQQFLIVAALVATTGALYDLRTSDLTEASYARIVAAVIGVAGTVVTIIGALALWNRRHTDDLARERHADERRQLRMLLALRAELVLNLDAQARQFTGDNGTALRKVYEAAIDAAAKPGNDDAVWPRAIISQTNDVHGEIKVSLSDLPASVLPEVIAYYQNDEYVAEILRAFNEGRLNGLPPERQRRGVDQLFAIGGTTAVAAFDAVMAINAAIAAHPARGRLPAADVELPKRQQDTIKALGPIVGKLRMDTGNTIKKCARVRNMLAVHARKSRVTRPNHAQRARRAIRR